MNLMELFKKREPAVVTLYRNECCSLCDEARKVLEKAASHWNLRIQEVDILSDTRLYLQYQNDVPIAVIKGQELFRHTITEKELQQRLRELMRSSLVL